MNKVVYTPEKNFGRVSKYICPTCKKKLSSEDKILGEHGFLCPCGTKITNSPSHHEQMTLGHRDFLVTDGDTAVSVNAGYLKVMCPVCKSEMEVKRAWHDKSKEKEDCRLVLGWVCKNRDCNYMNAMKFVVPVKFDDWTKA